MAKRRKKLTPAQKGWATRRRKAVVIKAKKKAASVAAKRGWETRRKKSAIAKKGWATRRREDLTTAQKGWETRRRKAAAKLTPAQKGWETRRRNQLRAEQEAGVRAEKEASRRRKISDRLKAWHKAKREIKAESTAVPRTVTPVKRRLVSKPAEMIRRMEDSFEACQDAIDAPSRMIGPEQNADNSVDGELRIDVEGLDAADMMYDIEACLVVPRGCWLSTGIRYSPTQISDEDIEKSSLTKFQGAIDVGGFYIKPSRADKPEWGSGKSKKSDHYANVRDRVIAGMERFGKPLEVYARLYWHPFDVKPQRRGEE